MRARLMTSFAVAAAAIVGISLTSTTTAAASTDFIHLSIYSDYSVVNGTASTHNGHGKIGGFQLTTAGYLVVCDDHADGVFIAGELKLNDHPYRYLVDTNGSASGCEHTTIPIPARDTKVRMEIDTGHTANTAIFVQGFYIRPWQ